MTNELNSLPFIYKMPSGAIQEINGDSSNNGIWEIKENIFYVFLNYPNSFIGHHFKLDAGLASAVNWKLIREKMQNGDYTNLPAREEFSSLTAVDFLERINVINKTLNPNVIVNGQPQQTIQIAEEYQMHYNDNILEIIDITDEVKSKREGKENAS